MPERLCSSACRPTAARQRTIASAATSSAGETPQIVVPRHHWQSAVSLGAWTLVGCTVAPGFVFSGFEMAPPDFAPGT